MRIIGGDLTCRHPQHPGPDGWHIFRAQRLSKQMFLW
jgi:hypothetical protein